MTCRAGIGIGWFGVVVEEDEDDWDKSSKGVEILFEIRNAD